MRLDAHRVEDLPSCRVLILSDPVASWLIEDGCWDFSEVQTPRCIDSTVASSQLHVAVLYL